MIIDFESTSPKVRTFSGQRVTHIKLNLTQITFFSIKKGRDCLRF